MNARDAGALLATCASYDQRTTGRADIIAWAEALSDLPLVDCQQAVHDHYREQAILATVRGYDRVTVPIIRARVRSIRADRIARNPVREFPPEIVDDPAAYRAALRAAVRAVGDGKDPQPAIAAAAPRRAIGGAR